MAAGGLELRQFNGISGSREGEFGSNRSSVGRGVVVRAAGVAGPGAGAERLVDNGLDGAGATAAFRAATKAAIDLLGVAGKVVSSTDGLADVLIAEHVAGTHNH
jgi:hypothetical protein